MTISEAHLSGLLAHLANGSELEVLARDLAAIFVIDEPFSERDVRRIDDFAAKFGCVFSYDAFGHYEPIFRKAPQR